MSRLNEVCATVTELIDKFELGMASQALYDFVWSEFCDWYIEFSKPVLYGTDDNARTQCLTVLTYVLDKILKMLHPFAPCLTEKLYQELPNHGESIMIESYPTVEERFNFTKEMELVENLKDLITRIRNIRAEYGVVPSKRIHINLKATDSRVEQCSLYIEKLGGCDHINFTDKLDTPKCVKIVASIAEVEIPLGDLVDAEKEMEKLNKQLKDTEDEISRAEGKLNNQGFVAKAPQQLIEKEKEKLNKYRQLRVQLLERIEELK